MYVFSDLRILAQYMRLEELSFQPTPECITAPSLLLSHHLIVAIATAPRHEPAWTGQQQWQPATCHKDGMGWDGTVVVLLKEVVSKHFKEPMR